MRSRAASCCETSNRQVPVVAVDRRTLQGPRPTGSRKLPDFSARAANATCPEDAARTARAALTDPGREGEPLLDLEARLTEHRLWVRSARLFPERGGPQALLIPLAEDGFRIPVDPTPHRGWDDVEGPLRKPLYRQRRRFLVAHELAHSLFYERMAGQRPNRATPLSETEERFCDEFACWLLLPRAALEGRPSSASAIFDLHRDFDVSVEVAARALTGANPELWAAIVVFDRALDLWQLQWMSPAPPPVGYSARFDPARRQLVLVGSPDSSAAAQSSSATSAYRACTALKVEGSSRRRAGTASTSASSTAASSGDLFLSLARRFAASSSGQRSVFSP